MPRCSLHLRSRPQQAWQFAINMPRLVFRVPRLPPAHGQVGQAVDFEAKSFGAFLPCFWQSLASFPFSKFLPRNLRLAPRARRAGCKRGKRGPAVKASGGSGQAQNRPAHGTRSRCKISLTLCERAHCGFDPRYAALAPRAMGQSAQFVPEKVRSSQLTGGAPGAPNSREFRSKCAHCQSTPPGATCSGAGTAWSALGHARTVASLRLHPGSASTALARGRHRM
jgi:hypothetical protein